MEWRRRRLWKISTYSKIAFANIAFFGDPSDASAFEVQFGGHHLGINATLDGSADDGTGAITFAPTHLGVQPAVYTDEDGNEVSPSTASTPTHSPSSTASPTSSRPR